jgi:hypothetical protein
MNEEQGGYQALSGFSRRNGNWSKSHDAYFANEQIITSFWDDIFARLGNYNGNGGGGWNFQAVVGGFVNGIAGGKRGALLSYNTNTGCINVTSNIYVYSNNMDKATLDCYASNIQSAINSYWNNPSDKGDGKLGRLGRYGKKVVFNVKVHGVTVDEIQDIIDNSRDATMSFFSLDGRNNSHYQISDEHAASEFNVEELESSGYSVAAHEYGHVLGYFVDKPLGTPGTKEYDNNIALMGFKTHAYRNDPNEQYFIMSSRNLTDPTPDRVHAVEYQRLNGGSGIYMPTHLAVSIGNFYINPPKYIR